MTKQIFLGEFELVVLLAVMRLGDEAYGVTIMREIEERTGRSASRGAVYITLERLEKKGYLKSHFADPTPERGGKAKRYFKIESLGVRALRDSGRALSGMWSGLEQVLGRL